MRRGLALLAGVVVAGTALAAVASAAGYDVASNCVTAPLQFVFDGKATAVQVANGNPAGFICNGTAYVPIRFMAQSLGQQVAYDGSTDTITVTNPMGSPATAGPTLQTGAAAGLGQIVVDGSGITLYHLTRDTATTSACYAECAATWPPLLTTGTPVAGPGLVGSLGTLTRTDGTMQVTYNGMPLYRYAGDSHIGDANGQGVGGIWFVVAPAAAGAAPNGGGTTHYGGGY
ncbi:MAG TPA: stalk domain-containing protein [Bacillota bacterium]|nr:stalk domain-containing protein [Bacillota bacterium]